MPSDLLSQTVSNSCFISLFSFDQTFWECITTVRRNCMFIISRSWQEIIKVREWIPHIGQFFRGYYSRDGWTVEATFSNYLRKNGGNVISYVLGRFIPGMFFALSAAFLCSRAFRLFFCSFGRSLFCRLFSFFSEFSNHLIYHVFVVSSLYTHFGGWLAASWYALMWQRDAVSEFICVSHYLAV